MQVEEFIDPFGPGTGHLRQGEHHRGEADGGDQLPEIGRERDERPDADGRSPHEGAAEEKQRHRGQRRDSRKDRRPFCVQPHVADAAGVERSRCGFEPGELRLLLSEPLHHSHTDDRLVGDVRQIALLGLGVKARRVHPLAQLTAREPQRRQHRQHDEREQRRKREHHGNGDDQLRHTRADERNRRDQLVDHRHVGVRPADDLSLRECAVRHRVQLLEVRVETPPEVGLRLDRHATTEPSTHPGRYSAEHGETDQRGNAGSDVAGPPVERSVDDVAHDDRHENRRQCAQERPTHRQEHQSPVRAQITHDPAEPRDFDRRRPRSVPRPLDGRRRALRSGWRVIELRTDGYLCAARGGRVHDAAEPNPRSERKCMPRSR